MQRRGLFGVLWQPMKLPTARRKQKQRQDLVKAGQTNDRTTIEKSQDIPGQTNDGTTMGKSLDTPGQADNGATIEKGLSGQTNNGVTMEKCQDIHGQRKHEKQMDHRHHQHRQQQIRRMNHDQLGNVPWIPFKDSIGVEGRMDLDII